MILSFSTGLLLRRYAATVLPDVYVALRQPESLRCIAVRLPSAEGVTLSEYSHLRDIRLEIMPDERDNSASYLLILLSSQQHREVFATLCEELIWGMSNLAEKEKIVSVLMNRSSKNGNPSLKRLYQRSFRLRSSGDSLANCSFYGNGLVNPPTNCVVSLFPG